MRKIALIAALLLAGLSGCSRTDDNAKPEYGNLGLPINCRAYVQEAVNGYRAKKYSADEAMNGLERNCGVVGSAWKNMRD